MIVVLGMEIAGRSCSWLASHFYQEVPVKTSSLFLMLRTHTIATLAGAAIVAASGPVGAQVVEDKNPTPPAKTVDSEDTVKSPVDKPDPTNPASAAELNTPQKAANSTGSTVYDKAKQGSADAKQAAQDATQNAATQTQNTVNRSAESVKNPTDTNASGQATTQTQGTNVRTNVDASTRTNAADPKAATTPQSTVQQRVNAGVQAGANAVNAAADSAAAANASGVGTGRIAAQLGLNFAADAANALRVSAINRNSVFASAGFQPNDQFVSIGGQPIANQAAFYRYLGTVPVGQRVPIVVMRNGQQQTIYWTPDQRFVQMQPTFRTYVAAAGQPQSGNTLGITLDPSVTDAAIVASVAPGSQAANAGVRQGDQIVALNDQEIDSASQFDQAASQLPANSPARIAVARTIELQANAVQQTGVAPTGPAVVQPAAPAGAVDPRAVPVGPVRRFRFR
jgi:membrane-associated protease RseP (regulator of RpoE activity)